MSTSLDRARLLDLQARFAAVGCELVKAQPNDWRAPLYVWFFGSTRTFDNLDQVEAFLPMVGGSMKQRAWPDAKAFETARAELALKGAALYSLNDDRGQPVLIASRGAETRKFTVLDEVRVWAGGVI